MNEKAFAEKLEKFQNFITETFKQPAFQEGIVNFVDVLQQLQRDPETATGHLIKFYRMTLGDEKFDKIMDEYYEGMK